jgi:hypothetical protein
MEFCQIHQLLRELLNGTLHVERSNIGNLFSIILEIFARNGRFPQPYFVELWQSAVKCDRPNPIVIKLLTDTLMVLSQKMFEEVLKMFHRKLDGKSLSILVRVASDRSDRRQVLIPLIFAIGNRSSHPQDDALSVACL